MGHFDMYKRTTHSLSFAQSHGANVGPAYLYERSVAGTSGGRRISNTRGPLSDVIEAAVEIIHTWRFTKLIV